MYEIKASTGARLRALRKFFGCPLRVLAARLACSVTTLSQIERGVRRPSLELAVRIEAATAIPASAWVEKKAVGSTGAVCAAPLKPERVQERGA